MTDLTIKELINRMPRAFIPEKAVGVDAVIQYHLTGAEAGEYIITVKDGKCEVAEGVAPNPKMTLRADSNAGLQGCHIRQAQPDERLHAG